MKQICRKEAKSATGEHLELVYDLLTTPGYVDTYGIQIRMHSHGRWESAQYRFVTMSGDRALALIRTLSEGLVTPTTLGEVLQDLL